MPAQRQPPAPVSLRLGCWGGWVRVFRGGEGPPQGVGAQGQVLGLSSCLGPGLAGGGGGGQGGSLQPPKKRGWPPSPVPREAGSSARVRAGDPETERLEQRGVLVWGQRTGPRGPVPPQTGSPDHSFGGEPGGRKGATPVSPGQAGPAMDPRETEDRGLLAPEGPPPPRPAVG